MPTIDFPSTFTSFGDSTNTLFALDFLTDWGQLQCDLQTNFCWKASVMMLVFLAFTTSMPATYALLRPLLRKRGWSTARLETFGNRAIKFMLLTMTIAHAPLSRKLLQLISCRGFGGAHHDGDGVSWFLSADLAISCAKSDGYRSKCVSWAAAFLPIYTAGIPALLAFIMWRYQSPLADARRDSLMEAGELSAEERERLDKRWDERADFFRKKYEEDYWYWELIEMARKLTLSGLLIFIAPGTVRRAPRPRTAHRSTRLATVLALCGQ